MSIESGIRIQYDKGMVMDCRAIMGQGDHTPFNFLDHFEPDEARKRASECSQTATGVILKARKEAIKTGDNLELPNASRVFEFVAGDLGMEPVGQLVYVDKDKNAERLKAGGYTDCTTRSAVVTNSTYLHFDTSRKKDTDLNDTEMSNLADSANSLRVEAVAAHELTHLAGVPDIIFFAVDEDTRQHINHVEPYPDVLNSWPDSTGPMKGEYFSEGLAQLVGHMYFWKYPPGFTYLCNTFYKTDYCKSPAGTEIHLPSRYYIKGEAPHHYTGWGIERLVELAPGAWNILVDSRKYGTVPSSIRAMLRLCIEGAQPGLFDHIDKANLHSLDEIMETTERIDHAAKKIGV